MYLFTFKVYSFTFILTVIFLVDMFQVIFLGRRGGGQLSKNVSKHFLYRLVILN